MKFYHTLVEPVYGGDQPLREYLVKMGIFYTMSAEFVDDLERFGYKRAVMRLDVPHLMMVYEVLIEECELSAIMLSVDQVCLINNTPSTNRRNTIRKIFSVFFD